MPPGFTWHVKDAILKITIMLFHLLEHNVNDWNNNDVPVTQMNPCVLLTTQEYP